MLCQSLLPQLDVSVPNVEKKEGETERESKRWRESERERVEKKKRPSAEVCQVDKAFRFGDVFRGSPFPAAKGC